MTESAGGKIDNVFQRRKVRQLGLDPWHRLGCAIVKQAVKDVTRGSVGASDWLLSASGQDFMDFLGLPVDRAVRWVTNQVVQDG